MKSNILDVNQTIHTNTAEAIQSNYTTDVYIINEDVIILYLYRSLVCSPI